MRIFTNSLTTPALILTSAMLLAACSSTKLDETKPPVEDRSASTTQSGAADPRSVATVNAGTTDPLSDPKGILARRSVYFDYDSYIVKDEFRPVIEANAKALSGDRKRHLAVEGHTDDRGSSEYNLALGQRRAESVVKSLTLLGAEASQLEAVSFGKERPAAQGEDEAAWAKNRRAELANR